MKKNKIFLTIHMCTIYPVLYIHVSRINLKIREYYHDITSNYVKTGINSPLPGSGEDASSLRNKGVSIGRGWRRRMETRKRRRMRQERKIALDVVETGEAVKQTVGRRASLFLLLLILSCRSGQSFTVYFRSACHLNLSALSKRSSSVKSWGLSSSHVPLKSS